MQLLTLSVRSMLGYKPAHGGASVFTPGILLFFKMTTMSWILYLAELLKVWPDTAPQCV